MFKLTLNYLVWITLIAISVKGQQFILSSYEKTNNIANLSFTTDISEQKYCSNSKMFLRFKVTLKNTGTIPIILDRDSKVIFKWKIKRISGKMKKNYETTIAPFINMEEILKLDQFPKEESLK